RGGRLEAGRCLAPQAVPGADEPGRSLPTGRPAGRGGQVPGRSNQGGGAAIARSRGEAGDAGAAALQTGAAAPATPTPRARRGGAQPGEVGAAGGRRPTAAGTGGGRPRPRAVLAKTVRRRVGGVRRGTGNGPQARGRLALAGRSVAAPGKVRE